MTEMKNMTTTTKLKRIVASAFAGLFLAGSGLGTAACSDDDDNGVDVDEEVEDIQEEVDEGTEDIQEEIDEGTDEIQDDDEG